jgi:hypothetical protein
VPQTLTVFRTAMLLLAVSLITGCVTVPMAPADEDALRKQFGPPPGGMAGLYIYRDTTMGGGLKKTVYIDGQPIGESVAMTYFYREVAPGSHVLSTESEFGDRDLRLEVEAGNNYFVDQNMRPGLTVYGAWLKLVPEEKGRKGVTRCKLAR